MRAVHLLNSQVFAVALSRQITQCLCTHTHTPYTSFVLDQKNQRRAICPAQEKKWRPTEKKTNLSDFTAFLGIIIFRVLLLLFCSSNDKTSQHKFTSSPRCLLRSLCTSPKLFEQLRSLFSLLLRCRLFLLFVHSVGSVFIQFRVPLFVVILFSFPYFRSFKLCSFLCHVRWHICFIIICLLDAFAFPLCCSLSVARSPCYSFMSQQNNVLCERLLYLVPNYFFIRRQQIFTFPFCVCVRALNKTDKSHRNTNGRRPFFIRQKKTSRKK